MCENMFIFCCLICCFGLVAGCNHQLNGTLGQSFVFKIVDPKSGFKSMTLRRIKEGINNRQILLTYDPTSKKDKVSADGQYVFSEKDSSFQIQKLQRKDEGTYEISVTWHNGSEPYCKYDLKVYEEITNVTLSATYVPQNDSCVLNCFLQTGDSVAFRWTRDKEDLNHNSNTLVIKIAPENATNVYTCRAENPVSSHAISITDGCRDTPVENELNYPFMYFIIALSVLILLIVGIFVQKAVNSKRGKFPVRPVSPPQRPPAQEPLSEPENQEICTIYSSIQKKESVSYNCSTVYELAGPSAAQP